MFNILDNEHDAEGQKKESDKEYNPKTDIKAYIQNNSWHIEISDNGPGMNKQTADQLFLPFFTTKATAEKGTGIGLAVIKSMVEGHNGSIYAESKEGAGTTFHVILPSFSDKVEDKNGK